MAAPTLASLHQGLGPELAAAPGFTVPAREVSAVHVSELLDPHSHLSGGELLLTTGLQLPATREGCDDYVRNLVRARISGLAFGLGPVHTRLPAPLVDACRNAGLPLLVVPVRTPFLRVTQTYWSQVSSSAARQLQDVVAAQRALVAAALDADPVLSILTALARACDGWAALFEVGGELARVVPARSAAQAREVSAQLAHITGAGVHAAASLADRGTAVLVYPLVVTDQVTGYLAVGTQEPLPAPRRPAVLTASALLSIDAVRHSPAEAAAQQSARCVASLVDLGEQAAAVALAGALRLTLPAVVRVIGLRTRVPGRASKALRVWCPDALVVAADANLWALVPAEHGPLSGLEPAVRRVDADAGVVVSAPVALAGVPPVRAAVTAQLAEGRGSRTTLPGPDLDDTDDVALTAVVGALGAPQLQALAAWLRHRGQWEAAAHRLGLHRNTLRYRVTQCQKVFRDEGWELEDPDVSARLWLLLRRLNLA